MSTPRDVQRQTSMGELWRIAWPIIVLELAGLSMLFVDRVFVGQRSTVELNAVVVAGTSAWALVDTLTILAEACNVRIAHRCGAGKDAEAGVGVWQMVWVSLGATVLFIPLAALGPSLFAGAEGAEHMTAYFRWLLWLGPVFGLRGALAGFYIGIGDTKILLWTGVLGAVVNLALDAVLIPGWGPIPALGVTGAAVATVVGTAAQVAFLIDGLWRRGAWRRYGFDRFALDLRELGADLKVGGPLAALVLVEMGGYAVFHLVYRHASLADVSVTAAAQSLLIPFLFVYIGLTGAATSVAGQLVGAGRYPDAVLVVRNGFRLALMGGALVGVVLLGTGPWLAELLSIPRDALGPPWVLWVVLGIVALKVTSASLSGVLHGVLAAATRTRTLLVVGAVSTWLFMVAPSMAVRGLDLPALYGVATWVLRDAVFCGLTAVVLVALLRRARAHGGFVP